ncbi:MAG TPA: hypothetical protein VFE37_16190 [Chloroflexota bacterium]|nr:hypothetical protein [Chloroflexota bacterium]
MCRSLALVLALVAVLMAGVPAPAAHAQDGFDSCQSFLERYVAPLLERSEAMRNEVYAGGGWLGVSGPFAVSAYPGPQAPLYRPTQPFGYVYRPNLPPPQAQPPLNSPTVLALLTASGAISPTRPQETSSGLLFGLAGLQQAEAARISGLWGVSSSYHAAAHTWNSTFASQALSLMTFAQFIGLCTPGGQPAAPAASGGGQGGATGAPAGASPAAPSAPFAAPVPTDAISPPFATPDGAAAGRLGQ